MYKPVNVWEIAERFNAGGELTISELSSLVMHARQRVMVANARGDKRDLDKWGGPLKAACAELDRRLDKLTE